MFKSSVAALITILTLNTGVPMKTPEASASNVGNQTTCPVMGFDINKDVFTDYLEYRIYFCCSVCPPDFKRNPDTFMKEMKEDGVILYKSPA